MNFFQACSCSTTKQMRRTNNPTFSENEIGAGLVISRTMFGAIL
jgi:hypothetical protein